MFKFSMFLGLIPLNGHGGDQRSRLSKSRRKPFGKNGVKIVAYGKATSPTNTFFVLGFSLPQLLFSIPWF